jgi:hypothetical protein
LTEHQWIDNRHKEPPLTRFIETIAFLIAPRICVFDKSSVS